MDIITYFIAFFNTDKKFFIRTAAILLLCGGIYYRQKEKAIQLMNRIGVQFPKVDINDGFVKNISHPLSKVKKRTRDIFKRSGYQLPGRLESLSSNIIIKKQRKCQ